MTREMIVTVLLTIVVGAAAAAPGASRDGVAAAATDAPPVGFEGGAGSIDALIDRFLMALQKSDHRELKRLSVTEDEYRRIIVPGRVVRGKPPRNPAERNVDYFWRTMAFKSELYAEKLIDNFGGRRFVDHKLELTRPVNEWAWYTAYGEVRLLLVPAEGDDQYLLQTGWIAEVDGVYKFLTYEYDS